MKLSTILPATLFAVFVHANDLLDVQKQCNNGYLVTDNYARPRISEASCVLTATRDAPGFDIHKQTGKLTLFFFLILLFVLKRIIKIFRFVLWFMRMIRIIMRYKLLCKRRMQHVSR